MDKDFYLNILDSIEFMDKQTDDNEKFGIYRIPTETGCIEFVKLYKDIIYKPHIHDRASAKFYFFKGSGFIIYNDQKIAYTEGTHYYVPAGVMHGFEQNDETIFLSVQSNPIEDRATGIIDIRYE